MQFTRLALSSTVPLYWEPDPIGYARKLRDFLENLLDPEKPGYGAFGLINPDAQEQVEWLVGREALEQVRLIHTEVWEKWAEILAGRGKPVSEAVFRELVRHPVRLFIDAVRLYASLPPEDSQDIPEIPKAPVYLAFTIDWGECSNNLLFSPQLIIANYRFEDPRLAPPTFDAAKPEPVEASVAVNILENLYWKEIETRFVRLRMRSGLGKAALFQGKAQPPVFYFAEPAEMPDVPEYFLKPPRLQALEILARTTISTHDLLSSDVTGNFLEGNLLTFTCEKSHEGAFQSYYLVIPWLGNSNQWLEVEGEFCFIADKLSYIDFSIAFEVWDISTDLAAPGTRMALLGGILDQAMSLVPPLQRAVAFQTRGSRTMRETYRLVALIREALARLEAGILKENDDFNAKYSEWRQRIETDTGFARRSLTARTLPGIPSLLENLDKREALRGERMQIETITRRAQQVGEYFSRVSESLSKLLDQQQRERQAREEQNQQTLSYALAALAVVTAFPLLIGSMNWTELHDGDGNWPEWAMAIRGALEFGHPYLVPIATLAAGVLIVALLGLLIWTRARPWDNPYREFRDVGKSLLQVWGLAEKAESIIQDSRAKGMDAGDQASVKQEIDAMDRKACDILASIWKWLEEKDKDNDRLRDTQGLRRRTERFVISTELLGNRSANIFLPVTLCLFRYRSTDFTAYSIVSDFEFNQIFGFFGFEAEEIQVINNLVEKWEGCSVSEFAKNLRDLGVSAAHRKPIAALDEPT